MIYGIDTTEIGVAKTTAYGGVAHAGWVGVTTYTDTHGKLRVKSEVLVAGSALFRTQQTTQDSQNDKLILHEIY